MKEDHPEAKLVCTHVDCQGRLFTGVPSPGLPQPPSLPAACLQPSVAPLTPYFSSCVLCHVCDTCVFWTSLWCPKSLQVSHCSVCMCLSPLQNHLPSLSHSGKLNFKTYSKSHLAPAQTGPARGHPRPSAQFLQHLSLPHVLPFNLLVFLTPETPGRQGLHSCYLCIPWTWHHILPAVRKRGR